MARCRINAIGLANCSLLNLNRVTSPWHLPLRRINTLGLSSAHFSPHSGVTSQGEPLRHQLQLYVTPFAN
jgi:hypothetical protein